ncbi:TPA: hypothetical protein DCY65_05835 [Candidatus Acetothermia bacterium]|nr:hypothetical protein [Candidatus Acetothermia bacterium]
MHVKRSTSGRGLVKKRTFASLCGGIERLGMAQLISPRASRQRNLALAMITAWVVAPGSKLATSSLCEDSPRLDTDSPQRHGDRRAILE